MTLIALNSTPMWMPTGDELSMLGPHWALVGTIVAILIGAIIAGRNWRVAGTIAMVGGLLTAGLCALGWKGLGTNWAGMAGGAGGVPMLVADQFSYFFIFLISIFLVLIAGMWFLGQDARLPEKLARKRDATEFYVLLVGSAFGMALMVSTTNLLMIIIAVEMTSLPSYALAGFRKKHRLATEASLKYILFGAVTSAIMIYGASLLYGQYHSLDIVVIGRAIVEQLTIGTTEAGGAILNAPTVLMSVSIVAFMIGAMFKVSAVPFHFWCPDVFEGASIEITTWLSVASKAAGLGLLLRVVAVLAAQLGDGAEQTLNWVRLAVAVMAALTCTLGNFSAYRQTNMKRLFAFSSIAHAGYMLMAVAIILPTGGAASGAAHPAFSAIVLYITVYLLMNLGVFGCIAMVYWATGREDIGAFNGLIRRSPVIAVMMVAFLFSLVGMPPLGGFIAKFWLLAALFDSGPIGILLVIVAVANTLFSLYYYARVAFAMCFSDDGQPAIRVPFLGQAAATVCALAILLIGTLWAGNIKTFSDERSSNLYAVTKQAEQPVEEAVKTAELDFRE